MAVFKCKMCSGALEINNEESVITCEYCGTPQTLPKLDSDRRVNLYDRANHFRRNNEFDKATNIYEQILNEDSTDAEAYWSIVLCRFGIEYVEEKTTHKRIPTVHRVQYTSIFDDDNYKSALQYADIYQRSIYESEAKVINEIQKNILAISQKEEPFDVFICYKETDNNGKRTPDSVLANELYHELNQRGFKVFFSRITLENKLGTAYEPYIFAALNSAKIMVVIGTKQEYFNAVWVKNEWSRYLSLIKQGQKKMLIPAYRDMDPYDLPEEFSHLQALDMSKLGFMTDLIRGIEKIIQFSAPKNVAPQETVVANANVLSMLKRVFIFLEDGDWSSADEYCEKALDIDPENGEAYLGKLMAKLRVNSREALKNQAEPFDNNSDFKKAIRFGDSNLKAELNGYIDYINSRNKNEKLDKMYRRAKHLMTVGTEGSYIEAMQFFIALGDYLDSAALAEECNEKSEIARKDAILAKGKSRMAQGYISSYSDAIDLFKSIPGWKDADEQIIVCNNKIKELQANQEAERKNSILSNGKSLMHNQSAKDYKAAINLFESIQGWKDADEQIIICQKKMAELRAKEAAEQIERERQAELLKKEKAKKAKRGKIIATFISLILIAVISYVIALFTVIIPEEKYGNAVSLMEAGNYEEAISAFQELNGYKDSNAKIKSYYISVYGEKTWNIINSIKVGDIYVLGSYEQDCATINGKEEIEWRVLAKEDSKILLISEYALDCVPFNTTNENVTWESCTLRKWLNQNFLNEAFTGNEKNLISTTTVTADKNPKYDKNQGKDTEDKIFLLSINEAEKYFTNETRWCSPTDYAVRNGAYKGNKYNNFSCHWLLRTAGAYDGSVADVNASGNIHEAGFDVDEDDYAVRPAMWIDLSLLETE
ncbi:MAG: toll/interleukin-1 receptor domain-containing protein [Ruminococcaceae bacterium]|nr:toll/interleukin-1 receptor domain-containing protein [Oscillospiraceae bacterium]